MKHVVIAPVGDSINSLYIGIKEIPTERVILLSTKEKKPIAEKAKTELDKFGILTKIEEVGAQWEDIFKEISSIIKREDRKRVVINVATADPSVRCAATAAAFVHGIRAFSTEDNKAIMLPVLGYSYYKLLTAKKRDILQILSEKEYTALDEIHQRTKMSMPLISYHINGNFKAEGLKVMGLVETRLKKGKIDLKLSPLGSLLIKGI
ncbi:hypothetical protein KY335_02645 [Candidatus Woesearchaeota archaeon]|nr:hypothetical protein [Candidatus Woesearchaeota archaeon]